MIAQTSVTLYIAGDGQMSDIVELYTNIVWTYNNIGRDPFTRDIACKRTIL